MEQERQKKAVWRCISRLEYGKKYCPDSPTVEETVLHRAIVEAIRQVAEDDGCQIALKNLQTHIRMYYGAEDSNTAEDEIKLHSLIDTVMKKAAEYDADSQEFLMLSAEIAETKKHIAERKAAVSDTAANEERMNEVLTMLDALKNHPIAYDDKAVRTLIDCIKVQSKNELLVIFKGGIEKTVSMD